MSAPVNFTNLSFAIFQQKYNAYDISVIKSQNTEVSFVSSESVQEPDQTLIVDLTNVRKTRAKAVKMLLNLLQQSVRLVLQQTCRYGML